MNKMFFALIAALPFIAGCWPFSKEQPKQEMTEAIVPSSEEATPSEEEMKEATEEAASGEEEMSEDK